MLAFLLLTAVATIVCNEASPIDCDVSCLYKGQHYRQGETWQDGCEYSCTCEDAQSGGYRCREMCPDFGGNLPSGCHVIKRPGECCGKPACSFTPTSGTFQPMAALIQGCYYKGSFYSQGQTWNDGCDYSCRCEDAQTGFYQCRQRCLDFSGLPPACHLADQAPGRCCRQPVCPAGITITIPKAYRDEYNCPSYQII